MKITGIKTYVLQADLGDYAFGWSQRVGNQRQTAICVVETDAGLEGYGEAFYFGGPSTIVAMIMEQAFGPELKRRLVFVDVWVDPNEHVYPMAIKGGSMRDMYLTKSLTSLGDNY